MHDIGVEPSAESGAHEAQLLRVGVARRHAVGRGLGGGKETANMEVSMYKATNNQLSKQRLTITHGNTLREEKGSEGEIDLI